MKEYFLGIDMGTSSVGWAATNTNYKLLREKGKDLWGVRLFEEAHTSAERRGYRISRRRRQREKARQGLLREMFSEAIAEVDPGFFMRLDDSKFYIQERSESNKQPYALFADTGYTDREYFKEYPTIFHLRKELLEEKGPYDVRLVYLAIANLFKRRGHFLNEALSEEDAGNSIHELYVEMQEKLSEYGIAFPMDVNPTEFENRLGEKGISRTKVVGNVSDLLGITKKQKAAYGVVCLMCGLSVKMLDIFGEDIVDEEHKKLAVSFRQSNYDEVAEEIKEAVGNENFELLELIKGIHDKGLLSNIMRGYDFLSQARVALYEEHKKDLQQLKRVLKRYDTGKYNEMFRIMEEGNYSAYVGSVNSEKVIRRINKGRSCDELYKKIKSVLSAFPQEDSDVEEILAKIEADTFLPKQLTFANGVIPNQLHLRELIAILKNAEGYLPFLQERDDSGLSVSEKIIQIYKFNVPYYVGPLSPTGQKLKDKDGYNVWAERLEDGKIYPWNFAQKVDLKTTKEKFIERMVRHCSYLQGKKALPKNSMLYEKFQVLDELNNLKIHGEKISVELKQDIYNTLFAQGKKVSLKTLLNYLEIRGLIQKDDKEAVTGIDDGFKASLTTAGKFYGLLGKEVHSEENRKMIEDIVFWGTVYGNDKKLLRENILEKYPDKFNEKELKRILGFKFEGWGRLSREFLSMEGASKEDGVIRSFIGALWETNDNHMELLSGRYTYFDTLKEMTVQAEKPLTEWTVSDLDDMYLSAPVKRMVWQTLSIIKELESVIGNAPKRIFVEVTRYDEKEKERKESRKQKLLELYKAIGKEASDWRKEIENRKDAEFKNRKLYLYYQQMGKCMYTGQSIDLDELMTANGKYDIDHIYPRHFIKDDSLENNLVLVDKTINTRKSDAFPLDKTIQHSQKEFWKSLKEKGLISAEKYNRLTRSNEFTAEEKAAFINRQIVETGQGTKVITQILNQAFPETEIVFSKASRVSDFRKKFEVLKVRSVNNYHHAHDAYLNIVVGNTYLVKFTKNPLNFIRDAEKYPDRIENKYNMDKIFDWDVSRNGEIAWIAAQNTGSTIEVVKKTINKNSPMITRLCTEKHGGITQKATIWNKEKAKGNGYIPIKMHDERLQDVTRYGGLTAVSTSGYSLIEYEMNGSRIRSLESIPVYLGRVDSIKEEDLQVYFQKSLQDENKKYTVTNVRVCRKFIPMDSLIKYNGFYYYLCGKTNECIWVKNAVELCFDNSCMNYIKKIEKALTTNNFEEKQNGELIITKERNEKLFEAIESKFYNKIYKNQIGVIGKILTSSGEKFARLNIEEQSYVLMQLIKNCSTTEAADLRLLGGAEKSGKIKVNKKISDATECILITQSVTGLFRAEIDLLTV